MIDYAYYNGIITPYDACCIPLSDRSIFFGDSVYDVILGHNKKSYQMNEHLERLYLNARRIGLTSIPDAGEIVDAVNLLIEESNAVDFMLYIQISGNSRRREHIRHSNDSNLLLTITEAEIPDKLQLVDVVTHSDLRHGYCDIKTTDLLPAVISATRAENEGADVSIFIKDSYVSECSSANISFIKENTLVTHPLDNSILPGICERNLINTCRGIGIGHERRLFRIDELYSADIVFITSTTKLLRICRSIDGIELGARDYELGKTIFALMWKDLAEKTK